MRRRTQPAVIAAAHVRKQPFEWSTCGNQIQYTSTRKNLPRDTYPALVKRLRVVIYNGDWHPSNPNPNPIYNGDSHASNPNPHPYPHPHPNPHPHPHPHPHANPHPHPHPHQATGTPACRTPTPRRGRAAWASPRRHRGTRGATRTTRRWPATRSCVTATSNQTSTPTPNQSNPGATGLYGGYDKDKWLPRARVVWWQRYAANNFTFITVKGGRHEVPETAPEQAFELVRRLVSGESF